MAIHTHIHLFTHVLTHTHVQAHINTHIIIIVVIIIIIICKLFLQGTRRLSKADVARPLATNVCAMILAFTLILGVLAFYCYEETP